MTNLRRRLVVYSVGTGRQGGGRTKYPPPPFDGTDIK